MLLREKLFSEREKVKKDSKTEDYGEDDECLVCDVHPADRDCSSSVRQGCRPYSVLLGAQKHFTSPQIRNL